MLRCHLLFDRCLQIVAETLLGPQPQSSYIDSPECSCCSDLWPYLLPVVKFYSSSHLYVKFFGHQKDWQLQASCWKADAKC